MNKNKILQCLSEVLKLSLDELHKLPEETQLVDLGMTSLNFIELIVKIEEEFQIEVLDSDLLFDNFSTINKFFQTLRKYFPQENTLKKVLILDADNVLWKGIAGEEKLCFDADVLSFQKTLIDLFEKGILLCLCSKNLSELISGAFASPEMLLTEQHFAIFLANRKDKASNIQKIAADLNLSPDCFVFADDSDYELGFVKINFPEVETVKIDYRNTAQFKGQLSHLFSQMPSALNVNRTQLYREQKEREKEKRHFTSIKDYNDSLETVAFCSLAKTEDIARLAELSMRTHQFNLSARQYEQDELAKLLSLPNYKIVSLSAQDKYGDLGIVGMAIAQGNTIEAFMLSCRVFQRDFEIIMLNTLKTLIREPLIGIYRETDKNHQFANFYPTNGVQIK